MNYVVSVALYLSSHTNAGTLDGLRYGLLVCITMLGMPFNMSNVVNAPHYINSSSKRMRLTTTLAEMGRDQ